MSSPSSWHDSLFSATSDSIDPIEQDPSGSEELPGSEDSSRSQASVGSDPTSGFEDPSGTYAPEASSATVDPDPEMDPWHNVQRLWAEWEASWQQVPSQTEQWWQQTLTSAQLQWGGIAREIRDRIAQALIEIPTETDSTEGESDPWASLRTVVTDGITRLSPRQFEVVISSFPAASDRALLASFTYHHGVADPDQTSTWSEAMGRAYGRSGLPIVLDPNDQVHIKASAALLSAIIAIEIASATVAGALQLLGSNELKKLFQADAKLRETVLKKGSSALDLDDQWRILQTLLTQPLPETDDWTLQLTHLGIQAAQISEFMGLRIREILQNEWLQLIVPLPFELILLALRLLTSDVMLSLGNTMESALDSVSASRRIELVLQSLPYAQRIPTPAQLQAATPLVIAETEEILRPLIAKQLVTAANSFDPQLRSTFLNQIGQQLNLINPFQWFQSWLCRDWILSLIEKVSELQERYPTFSSLEHLGLGLATAEQATLAMEQAQHLRSTAQILDPDVSLQS